MTKADGFPMTTPQRASVVGAVAKRLAIEAGADWPSLDGEAQDAWHERAIEHVRSGSVGL